MLTLIAGLVLSSTLGIQQARGAAPAPADPRERLDTAIAQGITLLEAKDYVKFLSVFVPPEVLTARGPIEQFATEFGNRKGPMALIALKQIQNAKPTMSADGTLATYVLDPAPEEGGPGSITWQKIGKYWYIAK